VIIAPRPGSGGREDIQQTIHQADDPAEQPHGDDERQQHQQAGEEIAPDIFFKARHVLGLTFGVSSE
jgi:hypothetical protein